MWFVRNESIKIQGSISGNAGSYVTSMLYMLIPLNLPNNNQYVMQL